jgi:hypothetical protein
MVLHGLHRGKAVGELVNWRVNWTDVCKKRSIRVTEGHKDRKDKRIPQQLCMSAVKYREFNGLPFSIVWVRA